MISGTSRELEGGVNSAACLGRAPPRLPAGSVACSLWCACSRWPIRPRGRRWRAESTPSLMLASLQDSRSSFLEPRLQIDPRDIGGPVHLDQLRVARASLPSMLESERVVVDRLKVLRGSVERILEPG